MLDDRWLLIKRLNLQALNNFTVDFNRIVLMFWFLFFLNKMEINMNVADQRFMK